MSELSPELLGELLQHIDKDLAVLMVLSHLGNKKHKDQVIQALYDVEFLKAKLEHIAKKPETREEAIKFLRSEGFLVS